jgi:hypothetical protein
VAVDTALIECADCWYKYGGDTVTTTLCSPGQRPGTSSESGDYYRSCPDCITEIVTGDKRYSASDGKIQVVSAVPANTIWGTERGPSHSALLERPGEL